jgi:hypothetical protein
MGSVISNLWPADLAPTLERTPLTILKEQAVRLGAMTKNLLEGHVDTTRVPDATSPEQLAFRHSFKVVAPTLDGYAWELLVVKHRLEPYPLVAHFYGRPSRWKSEPESRELNSEAEFIDYLRQVFASEETRGIIGTLLAQIGSSGRMVEGLLNIDKLPGGDILMTFAPTEGQGNSRPLLTKDLGQVEVDLIRTFGFSPAKARAQIAQMEEKGQASTTVSIDEELASMLFLYRRL